MARGSHDIGKIGESESWSYLELHGFVRPTKEERLSIQKYYFENNILIEKSGFDVILKEEKSLIGLAPITLYEVKTTGKKRGVNITKGFFGLGFTLTEKEYNNSQALNSLYKFIFVNLATETMKIYDLNEFFNEEKSRIYKTWSVFIKTEL